ncbi:MAG TPA: DAK2 domain-containing protein [Bacilli bacterium]|nr:DAK2 domain-containing protein [Bacilli bacterium]
MKTINGIDLKKMIISGANQLYNYYPEVDALNVFPVPDGDTGMNMNLTMSSGAKEVANRNDEDIYEIARAFSKGLLMGARGNSGVITSQIFRGFAMALEGKKVINAVEFAEAWNMGKEIAYKAVMRPVEGTILTVVREASAALLDQVNESWQVEGALDFMLKEARESLKRTPDLLPILKEVGVVDSGGAGLIRIMEGFVSALYDKVIEKNQATAFEEPREMAGASMEAEEFGYCTEFILRIGAGESEKKPFVEKRFNNVLNSHGNSIVMVRDDDIVKVHIHTLLPGNILSYAQQFGEFVTLKIENMSEQHSHLSDDNKLKDVKHSHQSLHNAADEEEKEYAIVAVAAGAGLEKMFKELRVDYIVSGGQTMNPATEDFVTAIKKIKAKHVFILPNNPNIVLAANQAVAVLGEERSVNVIPSKTIPQGLVACMMFNPEAKLEENLEEMNGALSSVQSGAITFSIKDTTIDGIAIKKDDYMALSGKKIVASNPDMYHTLDKLLTSMIDDMTSIVTIIYGEGAEAKKLDKLVKKFENKFGDVEFDVREGNQPVYAFLVGVE